jgi:hypothetical protein
MARTLTIERTDAADVFWLPVDPAPTTYAAPDPTWGDNRRFWRDIKRRILARRPAEDVWLGKLY